MPNNVVKTPRDEHLWSKSKSIAKKEYPSVPEGSSKFFQLVMGIYKKMDGGGLKKESGATSAVWKGFKKIPLTSKLGIGVLGLLGYSHLKNKHKKQNYQKRMARARTWAQS